MNRRYQVFFIACLLLIAGKANSGYNELQKEFDAYQPPAIFQDQLTTDSTRENKVPDDGFMAKKKQLQQIQTRWEASLAVDDGKALFYVPDPDLLNTLKGAKSDDAFTAAVVSRQFTLPEIEILTLLRNPGIRSAENRVSAAIERISQVTTWDEILRQYTAFTKGINTGVGPVKGKDPVAMKFPFPGVTGLKGRIAERDIIIQRENLEIARRDTLAKAQESYWNLIYLRRAGRIISQTVDLLNQLEEVATSRYESGRTSYQDVIKIQISKETLREKLITIKEQGINVESKLIELLNLPPGTKIGQPKFLRQSKNIPPMAHLHKTALRNRQELKRLRTSADKMALMIELAETMIIPPYTLNFSIYKNNAVASVGSFAMKDPFPTVTSPSRGAGLPKNAWFGTNDAYIRELRRKLAATNNKIAKTEAATSFLVRKAWFDLDKAKREEALYRDTVVGLSQSSLDVSTRGYETGRVSFADVIVSYRTWFDANLKQSEKQSDVGIAWSNLKRVVGSSDLK